MINFAEKDDIERLKQIWQVSFKDKKTFIDSYYKQRGEQLRTLVYRNQNAEAVSMLDLFPMKIRFQKSVFSVVYIYAVATLPAERGKGYARELIKSACDLCQKKGFAYAILIPQEPSLFEFYQKQGFTKTVFKELAEGLAEDEKMKISSLSEAKFMELKKNYENRFENVLLHNDDFLRLIYRQTLAAGGDVVQFEDKEVYALCYKNKETLEIKEISIDDIHYIHALCHYYKVKKYKCQRGFGKIPYAALKSLCDEKVSIDFSDLYVNTLLE